MIQNKLSDRLDLPYHDLSQAVKKWGLLPISHGAEAFDSLLSHYSKTVVLTECTEVYSLRQHADFAKRVRDAESLHVKTREIHTIAISHKAKSRDAVRTLLLLAELLLSAGYEVCLLGTVIADEIRTEEGFSSSFTQLPLPDEFSMGSRLKEMEFVIERYHIDAMLLFDYNDCSLLWDLLISRLSKVPVIVYRTESFSRLNDSQCFQFADLPWVLNLAHTLAVPSETDRLYASSFLPNSYAVPCLLPRTITEAPPISSNRQTILWIDYFTVNSQLEQMIWAFSIIHEQIPDAVLFMLTDFSRYQAEHHTAFLELIEQMNLKQHVIICGADKELSIYFNTSTLLIANSYYQESDMTILEAQSYGLPVVTYDYAPHTLADQNEGLVCVPWNKFDLLAEAVIELLMDDTLSQTKATASWHFIKQLKEYDYAGAWKTMIGSTFCPIPDTATEDQRIMWDTLYTDYAFAFQELDEQIAALETEISLKRSGFDA